MKNLILPGVVLSSMLGGAAMAADMPVKARPPVLAPFAWDRALIYAKGGAVFMDRRATVVDTCNVFPCGLVLVNARSGKNRDVSWAPAAASNGRSTTIGA
jgi:hypothetical protein